MLHRAAAALFCFPAFFLLLLLPAAKSVVETAKSIFKDAFGEREGGTKRGEDRVDGC